MALSYELESLIYYMLVQLRRIAPYWLLGLGLGSIISAYGRGRLERLAARIPQSRNIYLKIILAALLGASSPITLHGMIPILAALMQLNVGQHIISAFIVSSVLINPNVFIFSFALGKEIALLRLFLCILAGIIAGIMTAAFAGKGRLFEYKGFESRNTVRSDVTGVRAATRGFFRGIRKTAPNLALGIILAAVFQVYMPTEFFDVLFKSNRGLSVLYSASLGVPTYYCGGGTIPLIRAWMTEGMSTGSAIAFMISGPATKFTNLTAVKILMPGRKFWLFIVYSIGFAVAAGLVIDFITGVTM